MVDRLAPQEEASVRAHWDKQSSATNATWTDNRYIWQHLLGVLGTDKFWLNWLLEDHLGRHFSRALSLGCGSGDHELIMARTGLVDHIDAFDLSPGSLEIAKQNAQASGFEGNLHFGLYSFEEFLTRPNDHIYDLICFFGSLHHVRPIEDVLFKCRELLSADGRLIFNEYTGPCYVIPDQLSTQIIEVLVNCLDESFKENGASKYRPPSFEDQYRNDPSEGTRSALILPLLRALFEIDTLFPFGGTILHRLYPALRHQIMNSEETGPASIMRLLLALEDLLINRGVIDSDFHIGVCRNR